MTCTAIDNPASSEIRAVIHFLHAKNMNVDEQMFTIKSEVVDWPSAMSDELV
jgi:hypothetical protein